MNNKNGKNNNKQQKPAAATTEKKQKVDTMMVDEVEKNQQQQGIKRKNDKVSSSGAEPTLESFSKKAKKESNDTEEYINATQDPTFTSKITTNSSKIYKNILLISNLALSVDEIILKGCMNEIAEGSGNSSQKVKEILIFQKNLSSKEAEVLANNALRNAQQKNSKQATLVQGPKAAIVIFEKEFDNSQVFEDYNGAIIEGIPISIRFACENDRACLMVVKGAPISEEELCSYVEECGKLVSIESSKSNKNQFMVLFKEWSSVRECLLYNGADVHGAPCRIFACMFPAPSSNSSKFKGGNKAGGKRN